MGAVNKIEVTMDSKSQNEAFARMVSSAVATQLDPTVNEMTDIKTAVSEAVTNCIIHGYEDNEGKILMEFMISDDEITIVISDKGKGIEDISKAMEPLYTSRSEMERSGIGFTVMETFMDKVLVESKVGVGTKITMSKKIVHKNVESV